MLRRECGTQDGDKFLTPDYLGSCSNDKEKIGPYCVHLGTKLNKGNFEVSFAYVCISAVDIVVCGENSF